MGKRWSGLASNSGKAPHHDDFHSRLVRLESDMDEYDRAYLEGRLLGEGITGSVREVEHIASGRKYAMKSINLDRIDKAQVRELKTEIEILKQLDHPNIVRLHQVFQNKNNIKIVMELLTGGDLSRRRLEDEEDIRRVIFQLLSACRYWHARGVVHRDLKLENVLFSDASADSDVKVIDFGLGTTFYSEQLLEQQRRIREETARRPKSGSLDFSAGNNSSNNSSSSNNNASRLQRAGSSDLDAPASSAVARTTSSSTSSSAAFVSLLRATPRMGGSSSQLLDRRAAATAAAAAAVAIRRAAEAPEPRLSVLQSGGGSSEGLAGSSSKSPMLVSAGTKLRRGSMATVNKVRRSAMGSPAMAGPRRSRVTKSRIFQTTCGTAYYMAPEIMFGRGYTEKCDLWAVGVLTYMLVTRKPPFPGKNEKEVFQRVRRSSPSFEGRAWNRVSPAAKDFCKHLLTVNPTLRWTSEQALASPWLAGDNKSAGHRRRGSSGGVGSDFDSSVVAAAAASAAATVGVVKYPLQQGPAGAGSSREMALSSASSSSAVAAAIAGDEPLGDDATSAAAALAEEAAQNLAVARSMQRFARYPILRRAALMIVSHNQANFQNRALNRCFLAIDQSNRGFFGPDDLRAFVHTYDPAGADEARVQAVFASLDQDRSGVVRYMEFLAACIETTGPISDAQIAAAFEHFVPERGAAHITVRSLQRLLGRAYSKRDLQVLMAETGHEGKMALPAFRRMMRAPAVAALAHGTSSLDYDDDDDEAFGDARQRESNDGTDPRARRNLAAAQDDAEWRTSAASDPGMASPDGESAVLQAQRRWQEQQESIGAFDFTSEDDDDDANPIDEGDEDEDDFFECARGDSFELQLDDEELQRAQPEQRASPPRAKTTGLGVARAADAQLKSAPDTRALSSSCPNA